MIMIPEKYQDFLIRCPWTTLPSPQNCTQMPAYEYIYFPLWKGARGSMTFWKLWAQNAQGKKKKKLKSSGLDFFFPKQKKVKTFCSFLWEINRKKSSIVCLTKQSQNKSIRIILPSQCQKGTFMIKPQPCSAPQLPLLHPQ